MRNLAITLIISLTVVSAVSPSIAAEPSRTIQVVVDNSGTFQNVKNAIVQEKTLFWRLVELRKRSGFRNVIINVVSINNPRNLFVGTSHQLWKNGSDLIPKLAVIPNGCADLVAAFEQVKANIEMNRATRADIYVFSSLINTNTPCQNITVNLPQKPPENLDLSFLKDTGSKLTFFWVHSLQVREWHPYLQKAGLDHVRLYDEEGTKRILRERLADE